VCFGANASSHNPAGKVGSRHPEQTVLDVKKGSEDALSPQYTFQFAATARTGLPAISNTYKQEPEAVRKKNAVDF
jgi:hypothetical protein